MLKKILLLLYCLFVCMAFAYTQTVADTIAFSGTCVNQLITFTSNVFDKAPAPDSIVWNFGDPASGIFNISAGTDNFSGPHVFATSGSYTVTLHVTDIYAGTFDILTTIQIVAPVAVNFGPDVTLCEGDSVTLAVPAIAGAEYEWNNADTGRSNSITVSESGTYTVKINGCTVTDTAGVYFSRKPQLNLGGDHFLCKNELLTLNAASQNASYKWKLNGSFLTDTTAQLITSAPGGQYIALIDVLGCGAYSDTANITYADTLETFFSLGPDTLLCPKQVYVLPANAAGATAYNWSTGSTSNQISITDAGTYWTFVTIQNFCEVVDTVLVSYRGDETLDLRDTVLCEGESVVLYADFGTGTYHWSADPPLREDQDSTNQSTLYVYKAGTYWVTAQVGNCMYNDTSIVSYNDSLKYNLFPANDTLLCNGELYALHVAGNADTLLWSDGSMGTVLNIANGGNYFVIAKNACGADTSYVNINYQACPCELRMPTAFTPNGDGLNDLFRPFHACNMSDYKLSIFNRFGQLLFTSNDPYSGWNGSSRGAAEMAGTYVWMATYTSTDLKKKFVKKGTVVLLR